MIDAIRPSRLLVGWILRQTCLARGALVTGLGCAFLAALQSLRNDMIVYCIFLLFLSLVVLFWLRSRHGSDNLPLSWSRLFPFVAPIFIGLGTNVFLPLLLLYLLGSLPRLALRGLHGVDNLPLSRRQLFPYVALPTLIWLVVCVVAGSLTHGRFVTGYLRHEPVDLTMENDLTMDGRDEYYYQVLVPAWNWRLELGRGPAPIRAPWGEEISPTLRLPFPRLPIHLYNPYEVGAKSSIEFVSWQLSRAVKDVYGAHISPEDLRERYLEVRYGVIGVRQRKYALQELRNHPYRERLEYGTPFLVREDDPELKVLGPPNTLATAFLLCVLAWAFILSVSLSLNGWRRMATAVLIGVSGYAVVFFVFLHDVDEPVWGAAFRFLAESLPENGLFCWVMVLLVGIAIYLLLERLFSEMEIRPRTLST